MPEKQRRGSSGPKINTDPRKIKEVLARRVEQILPSRGKLEHLIRTRRIKLYLGIDPTGEKLHLGHTITLRKLQEFATLGHECILVIGTGTVLAGDPSLREKARPRISEKEIKKNIKNWKDQTKKILDFSKIKIQYNGNWLLKLGLKEIIDIASRISAVKLFQREMFQKRIKKGGTVWAHEILYPLLQGYDSVAMAVDLEIGGTDQTFNMLIGRELLRKIRNQEKFILTCPMLPGIDGRPMSKTSGNCVWIDDPPNQMFGKLMSIPDNLITPYFELLADLPLKKTQQYNKMLQLKEVNPVGLKKQLAFEITKIYHSEEWAQKAAEEFGRVFKEKKIPLETPKVQIKEKSLNILDFLVETKIASSKSEAKRLILQKGVKIDGVVQQDWRKIIPIKKGMIIQAGKRKFIEVI